MFAMALGKCCCSCEDCCNGSFPDEFEITLDLVDDYCNVCDSFLSGTYTLQKASESGACYWVYFSGELSAQMCLSPYNTRGKIKQVQVLVGIYCNSDTTYLVTIQMTVWWLDPFKPDYIWFWQRNNYYWRAEVARSEFDCTTVSDLAIPYLYSVNDAPQSFCDASADAVLTAVP